MSGARHENCHKGSYAVTETLLVCALLPIRYPSLPDDLYGFGTPKKAHACFLHRLTSTAFKFTVRPCGTLRARCWAATAVSPWRSSVILKFASLASGLCSRSDTPAGPGPGPLGCGCVSGQAFGGISHDAASECDRARRLTDGSHRTFLNYRERPAKGTGRAVPNRQLGPRGTRG